MRRRGLAVWLTAALLAVAGPSPSGSAATELTSGWPVTPVRVVRDFDPPPQRWLPGHRGIDLAAAAGAPVLAAHGGRISVARQIAGRGVVVVQAGKLQTSYEPLLVLVGEGQRVAAGDVIGTVSGGGHCGGSGCVHWGLRRDGVYVDPRILITQAGPRVRLLPRTAADVAARRSARRAAEQQAVNTLVSGLGPGPRGGHRLLRPVPGAITSRFGPRLHPLHRVWRLHDGTDFTAPCGSPIVAASDGVVTSRTWHPAYGHRLLIEHGRVGGQRVRTGYNHAIGYRVQPGQRVRRGQAIGSVGSTGLSTGCHLHLMLWVGGRLTNPERWL